VARPGAISEFQLVRDHPRFRMGYVAEFGAVGRDDPLYEAVSEGRAIPAWSTAAAVPGGMDTLFDYFGSRDRDEPQGEDRFASASGDQGFYEARREALEDRARCHL